MTDGVPTYPSGFDTTLPVLEQAFLWLHHIESDQCSDGEHLAFTQWLELSQTHAEAYHEASRLWKNLDQIPDVEARLLRSENRASISAEPIPFQRKARHARVMGGLALLAACFVAVAAVWTGGLEAVGFKAGSGTAPITAEHYQTGIGEIKRVELADGSVVVLSGDAKLKVTLRPENRFAELQQGEAFFEVHHDAERPFIVDAGTAQVRVLGTSFDVRRGARDFTVSVISGRVNVSGEAFAQPHVLNKGQQLQFDNEGADPAILPFDMDQVLGWQDKRFYYDNAPLRELVTDVNRYSSIPIVILTEDVGDIAVSAAFEVDQRDDVLAGLGSAFSLDITREKNRIVISHRAE